MIGTKSILVVVGFAAMVGCKTTDIQKTGNEAGRIAGTPGGCYRAQLLHPSGYVKPNGQISTGAVILSSELSACNDRTNNHLQAHPYLTEIPPRCGWLASCFVSYPGVDVLDDRATNVEQGDRSGAQFDDR